MLKLLLGSLENLEKATNEASGFKLPGIFGIFVPVEDIKPKKKFLEYLQGLSEKEVKRLISKRESLLNVSAVFHVISGAHRLYSEEWEPLQQS